MRCEPAVGDVVDGRFELERRLEGSPTHETFIAIDRSMERRVELTLFAPQWMGDPRLEARFSKRARSRIARRHENLARCWAAGLSSHHAYLAGQPIDGERLDDFVRRKGGLDPREFLPIASQLLKAACSVQSRGDRLHDITPSSIFLTHRHGHALSVQISDVGLIELFEGDQSLVDARLAATSAFRAPEELLRDGADVRADVYALGALFHFMLCGRPPFEGSDLPTRLHRQVTQEAPSIHVRLAPGHEHDERVLALVDACLATNPLDRPRDASALTRALVDSVDDLALFRLPRLAPAEPPLASFPGAPTLALATPTSGMVFVSTSAELDYATGSLRFDLAEKLSAAREASLRLSASARVAFTDTVEWCRRATARAKFLSRRALTWLDARPLAATAVGASLVVAAIAIVEPTVAALRGTSRSTTAIDASSASSFGEQVASLRALPPSGRAQAHQAPAVTAMETGHRAVPPGRLGAIEVTSTPRANVFVDGRRKGTTPLQLELPEGDHAISLEAANHEDHREQVQLAASEKLRLSVRLLPSTAVDLSGNEPAPDARQQTEPTVETGRDKRRKASKRRRRAKRSKAKTAAPAKPTTVPTAAESPTGAKEHSPFLPARK